MSKDRERKIKKILELYGKPQNNSNAFALPNGFDPFANNNLRDNTTRRHSPNLKSISRKNVNNANDRLNKLAEQLSALRVSRRNINIPENFRLAKTKMTLSNGDCMYSSVFRAAREQNLLKNIKEYFPDLPINNEANFIKDIRNIIANYADETLGSIYNNLKDLEKNNKNVLNLQLRMDGVFSDYQKDLIRKYIINTKNKEQFKEEYKEKIKTKGVYASEIEYKILEEILFGLCGIRLISIANDMTNRNKKNIAHYYSNTDRGIYLNYEPNTIYIQNQGGGHYEYFSFKP